MIDPKIGSAQNNIKRVVRRFQLNGTQYHQNVMLVSKIILPRTII